MSRICYIESMWLNYLILLSNITAYYYCNFIIVHIIIVHIIIVHIIIVHIIIVQFIYQSINILWIINCKYYSYIASYSMTYAVNKGGSFIPEGAVLYRYIIAPGGSNIPAHYCPPAALYPYNTAPPPAGIRGGSFIQLHRDG